MNICEVIAIVVTLIIVYYLCSRQQAGESMCVGQGCSTLTLLRNAIRDPTGLRTNYG